MKRRDFVQSLVTGTLAVPVTAIPQLLARSQVNPPPTRALRILMLGGTNFVGPHLVQAALDRGHEVALFNRGVTNPHLFPELERLRGTRYPGRDDGLAALDTARTWDAVIDTWAEAPGAVDRAARLLASRTGRYVYVSSIATYRSFREPAMTEAAPLLDAVEHISSFDAELGYRLRKRAAEQSIEGIFGQRATVLRCTSIAGLNHSRDANRHAGYWAFRFLLGEPLLAPEDATAVIQLIDVKDVARFAIGAIERDLGGAYNLVGPEEPLLLRDYLLAWSEVTGARSRIVWMDPQFLLDRGVRPFDDIQNWIPADDPEPGFYRISNRHALTQGLTYRPLEATIRDEISALRGEENIETPGGMSRARELELIEAWNARGHIDGPGRATASRTIDYEENT